MQVYMHQWFKNTKGDFWAGLVVALALIPEAIAFSILAGVDPKVGLYSSFIIAVVISFAGGRPAMISAATGAMSIVVVSLVKDHGLQYLLAATVLTGIIQIFLGYFKISRLMKYIPNAVMLGFVNSLAILVFIAQMPHFIKGNLFTWAFLLGTILLIYIIPYAIKTIPSPLIAVVLLSILAIYTGVDLKTVGDMGVITQSLPTFFIPNIPMNFETFRIIYPYSLALAIVGLMESLLTASILDDMTKTESNKNVEACGQGIANIITGFFGGMAGCAMIGQSIINVRTGARGRFSTFVAGSALMFLIIVLGDYVMKIPMSVLAGVMIVVCITQFDWSSFKYLVHAQKKDAFTMVLTIALVIYSNNLAIGVVCGVIVSSLFFIVDLSKLEIMKKDDRYLVKGQLFFASTENYIKYFKYLDIEEQDIIIDLSESHIWDDSAVNAVKKVSNLLQDKNIHVSVIGLNEHSEALIKKNTGKN